MSKSNNRIGDGFFDDAFHEPKLLKCILELIKNSFDWGATSLWFITNEARDRFRHIDNGEGFNAGNREAFLSVRMSNARGKQSGKHGTGSKKIIYTFSSNVRAVTAPADEPKFVYIAEFTKSEMTAAFFTKENLWVKHPKTAENWPHEHPFGFDITYTLKDPRSDSIYRGKSLAQKLSARLHNQLVSEGSVLVDGEPLPLKNLEGVYSDVKADGALPGLGEVIIDLYRPKQRSQEDDLMLTGRRIGEVSFRKVFIELLNEDQRAKVPAVFLEPECCGVIIADFLNEHTTHQRDTYNNVIADDERVNELLRYLRNIELNVAKSLGIKLKSTDASPADRGREEEDELIGQFKQLWKAGVEQPVTNLPGGEDDGFGDNEGEGAQNGVKTGGRKKVKSNLPDKQPPYLLIVREEFALGEDFEVTLVNPHGSTEDFDWHLHNSNATLVSEDGPKIVLKADKLGRAYVQATQKVTGISAIVNYETVPERVFKLSNRGPARVSIGNQFAVRALNSDKLEGKLMWELETGRGLGAFEVAPRGKAARFTAERLGRVVIKAYDSLNPEVQDFCEVRVIGAEEQNNSLFRIRDEFFVRKELVLNTYEHRKLVTIIFGGDSDHSQAGSGGVHELVINANRPSYQAALKRGTLKDLLASAIAFEFAKHFCIDWETVGSTDNQSVLLQAQTEADKLLEEILSSSS